MSTGSGLQQREIMAGVDHVAPPKSFSTIYPGDRLNV